jgi:hypothetical protein
MTVTASHSDTLTGAVHHSGGLHSLPGAAAVESVPFGGLPWIDGEAYRAGVDDTGGG